MAVAAAGHQAQKRRFQVRVGEVERGDVPPQMVHRDEGLLRRIGKALCEVDPHQHRADQPGGKGDGHAGQVGGGEARVGQGLLHGAADEFHMAAAGDLGHDAAIQRLLGHAGGHHIAEQLAAVFYHGGGGLVAAGFDA